MKQNIKPELSKKNSFYISKHRMYELKHFCMQYREWVQAQNELVYMQSTPVIDVSIEKSGKVDPTADLAELRAFYNARISMVSDLARAVDPIIGQYIFLSVTKDLRYAELDARYNLPCGRDYFYNKLREFYWKLSEVRK